MTIERRRNYFFGLFPQRTTIVPGDTYRVYEDPSILEGIARSFEIEVFNPHELRLKITEITLFGPPSPPKEKFLISDEINDAKIRITLFPGITERIIWKPSI